MILQINNDRRRSIAFNNSVSVYKYNVYGINIDVYTFLLTC